MDFGVCSELNLVTDRLAALTLLSKSSNKITVKPFQTHLECSRSLGFPFRSLFPPDVCFTLQLHLILNQHTLKWQFYTQMFFFFVCCLLRGNNPSLELRLVWGAGQPMVLFYSLNLGLPCSDSRVSGFILRLTLGSVLKQVVLVLV